MKTPRLLYRFSGFICLLLCSALLPSCTALTAAITGQQVPSTLVKRDAPNAVAFPIATQDVLEAEANPTRTRGLYDLDQVTALAAKGKIIASK